MGGKNSKKSRTSTELTEKGLINRRKKKETSNVTKHFRIFRNRHA